MIKIDRARSKGQERKFSRWEWIFSISFMVIAGLEGPFMHAHYEWPTTPVGSMNLPATRLWVAKAGQGTGPSSHSCSGSMLLSGAHNMVGPNALIHCVSCISVMPILIRQELLIL